MKKRGQVTTFIIVGIVAVIAILVLFFLKNTIVEGIAGTERINAYLEGEMKSVGDEIERCVIENTEKDLEILGKQGGFFNPKYYLDYYGNKISFLCMDIPNDFRCSNVIMSESRIEEQLNERLTEELKGCINLGRFNFAKLYDYELIYDMNSLEVDTEVNSKNILVNVNFPVTIKKDEFEINKDVFVNNIDVPMGEILSIVNDIIKSESLTGNFNTLSYDLFSLNKYLIKKYRPFGNKLYTIRIVGIDYLFQFAVEEND